MEMDLREGEAMATFKHPSNGYEESVSILAPLWALLFGPLYFAVKGAWGAAVIETILLVIAFSTAIFAVFLVPVVWVIFAIAALGIVNRTYLRKGWVKV